MKHHTTYTCRCTCGWRSRRRINPDDAIAHGEEHLDRTGERHLMDGRLLVHCTLLDRN